MICCAKYMHLTNLSKVDTRKIEIELDGELLSISFRPQKRYTNILIDSKQLNILKSDLDIAYEFTDIKKFNCEQLDFDKRYGVQSLEVKGESIHYAIIGDIKKAKKILVTFPGISSFDNVHHRLSALTSVQKVLCGNAIIIAFQDRESVYGNYMYKTDRGTRIKSLVEKVINETMVSMNISEENLIFYGNSKGGSICFDYIDVYKKSYFFIDIPQIDLYNYESQNDLLRYTLGEECRLHHNYKSKITLLNSDRVTYSFAENDYDASRNIPVKEIKGINVSILKDSGHTGAAMRLVLRQMTKISQIVNEEDPIVRSTLTSPVLFDLKNRKMFFNRRLGAFKNEDCLKSLYAEIKLSFSDRTPISISLNQVFDGKTVVVSLDNGFCYTDLFPELDFISLDLIVYFKFKEFVYPLSEYEIINL